MGTTVKWKKKRVAVAGVVFICVVILAMNIFAMLVERKRNESTMAHSFKSRKDNLLLHKKLHQLKIDLYQTKVKSRQMMEKSLKFRKVMENSPRSQQRKERSPKSRKKLIKHKNKLRKKRKKRKLYLGLVLKVRKKKNPKTRLKGTLQKHKKLKKNISYLKIYKKGKSGLKRKHTLKTEGNDERQRKMMHQLNLEKKEDNLKLVNKYAQQKDNHKIRPTKIRPTKRQSQKMKNTQQLLERNPDYIIWDEPNGLFNPIDPGEKGMPVITYPYELVNITKAYADYGFNQYVSDKISLHRSLPDPRPIP